MLSTCKICKFFLRGKENTTYFGIFPLLLKRGFFICKNKQYQVYHVLQQIVSKFPKFKRCYLSTKLLEHSVLRTFTAQGGMSGPNYIDSFDESRSRCDCSARASFYIFQARRFDKSTSKYSCMQSPGTFSIKTI